MVSSPPALSPAARTVHAFLVASTLIISSGAFIVTRSMRPLSGGAAPIDWMALLVGGSALWIVLLLKSRFPGRAGRTLEDWWRENLGRGVMIWALLELPAILGSVALFATGHYPIFAALVLTALGGLLLATPARLAGD